MASDINPPTGMKITYVKMPVMSSVMVGVTMISSDCGTKRLILVSTSAIKIAARRTPISPPLPGRILVPNNIISAAAGLMMRIPANAPNAGEPPNSFAAFVPTNIPR